MFFKSLIFFNSSLNRFALTTVTVFMFFVGWLMSVQAVGAVDFACVCTSGPKNNICKDISSDSFSTAGVQCATECGPGNQLTRDETCITFCKKDPVACGKKSMSASDAKTVKLANPLGEKKDLLEITGGAINVALGILGSITLLVFVVGGVMWLTSAGNPERVKKGSMTMLYAAIGLAVIFSAFAVLSLVIGGLTG